jgi:hypothetical protein
MLGWRAAINRAGQNEYRDNAMKALPIALILTAAVGLGLYLGWLYLRGVRKPVLNGIHILLGAGALEGLAVLLHGAPNGAVFVARSLGVAALGLFAYAMFSGLTGPVFGRQSRRAGEAILVTHVSAGLIGFAVFLWWVARNR